MLHYINSMHKYYLLLLSALLWSCTTTTGPPYAPGEALGTIEVEEGFAVELFAAEPLVQDPVAMTIDEWGRVYVVEMPGYPLDTGGSGRVKLLSDTDGDGYPDTATLFAEGLTLPNGVMRWKQGVIVTDPPDVLYLEDTDADGVADIREVMLTGFALSNPQHNANTPLYGLDNWIYIANNGTISWTEKYADPFGDTGGEIFFPAQPEAPRLPPNGFDRNIRFRADTFELQMRSGDSQFGHTFDTWGRHFLNTNSHHHYYEALAAPYLERNLSVAVGDATQTSLHGGNASQVFPITVDPEHQLLTDRGVMTSACGITWYHGGLFPAPYNDNITFTAEPVHNLVHVNKVTVEGNSFVASRIREGKEFLASTDSWFRPVNFTVGPDGALYLVDYYRQIVEHPEWMDDEVVEAGNLTEGTSRGRIYRIVPEGTPRPSWVNALEPMDTSERVHRLADANGWWRMAAQRLLVSERDTAAIPLLREQLSQETQPEGRLHILWSLHGLGALRTEDIRIGLEDPHPGVRENAVRLAEMNMQGWGILRPYLLQLVNDTNAKVRYQVLTTLGLVSAGSEEILRAQEQILRRDIDDEWVQVAALLSMPSDRLLRIALNHSDNSALVEKAAGVIAREQRASTLFARVLASTDGLWWHAPVLRGIASAGSKASTSQAIDLIAWVWSTENEEVARAILALLPVTSLTPDVVDEAYRLAQDPQVSLLQRLRAVRILSIAPTGPELLITLFTSEAPLEVQLEVLRGLRRRGGVEVAVHILDEWTRLTPQLRRTALETFGNAERAAILVEALETGVVSTAELSWNQRVRLMRDTPEPTRSRARALLQVIEEAHGKVVTDLVGDFESGAYIFAATCASCHTRGFGPDLATVSHWPDHMLIDAIRNPSKSISSGFELWQVVTVQGDTLRGAIASETPSAVRLVDDHTDTIIHRSEIESVLPMTISGMPEELVPDPQQLADLLEFLKQF